MLQQLGSTASPDQAALIKQLLPLLQQQLTAGAAPSGGETALLQQMLTSLQPQGSSKDAVVRDSIPASYNPATGISGQEVDAMLAHSNGTGAEVQFSDYDKAAASHAVQSDRAAAAAGSSNNPAMGISGDEITAMLARANGTGPEVNFADYHTAPVT